MDPLEKNQQTLVSVVITGCKKLDFQDCTLEKLVSLCATTMVFARLFTLVQKLKVKYV